MDQSVNSYKTPQDLGTLTGKRQRREPDVSAGEHLADASPLIAKRGALRPDNEPSSDEHQHEPKRIRERRRFVSVDDDTEKLKPWGLALSGGGIRSATFSLGVTQALAQSKAPSPAGYRSLARFDYLSTVSGGGYIGSFIVSLFMKNRLKADSNETQAAANASSVLQTNPPLRLRHAAEQKDASAAEKFSLSWLRENGRYLTPNGAGDVFFAATVGIRNFCAVHYVIATVLFTAFLLSQAIQTTLVSEWGQALKAALSAQFFPPSSSAATCDSVVKLAVDAAASVKASVVTDPKCATSIASALWLSLWWVPAFMVMMFVTVPVALAFWIVHPARGGSTSDKPRMFSEGAWGYVALIVALKVLTFWFFTFVFTSDFTDLRRVDFSAWTALTFAVVVPIVWCFIALVVHAIAVKVVCAAASASSATDAASISQERRRLSLWLENALLFTLLLSALAALETVAQTAFLYVTSAAQPALVITTTAYGALAWFTHKLVVFFNEKTESGFLRKLPMSSILNVLGIVVALLLACFWAYLAVGVRCNDTSCGTPAALPLLWWLVAFTAFAAVLSGLFPGFVNLSSWHAFYSSRLRRAYLGATNRARFGEHSRSVVETHMNDEPNTADYRAASGAPIHLINVCVNQTMGAGGQLVQRDRKGKNLCVGPFGYTIDDTFYTFAPRGSSADASTDLSISEWVGVSGAAFSTGLGRATSLGSSLLLGFANVRLGRWWPSYASAELRTKTSNAVKLWRGVLKSQKYLFRELTARFPGSDREWLYLSDGGHFENTALYELLRPERGIRFMVVCDNGCDTKYEFDDLANAIRLARIDHGVEVVVDTTALNDPILSPYLATPTELREALTTEAQPGKRSNRCAVLLKATHADWPNDVTHILLIKPRLIAALPEDVLQYAQTHPDFPQQTTADQFFDEAQWESYRKLGLSIGNTLFGDDTQTSPFWTRLQHYVSP
jgi:hypothetical protein